MRLLHGPTTPIPEALLRPTRPHSGKKRGKAKWQLPGRSNLRAVPFAQKRKGQRLLVRLQRWYLKEFQRRLGLGPRPHLRNRSASFIRVPTLDAVNSTSSSVDCATTSPMCVDPCACSLLRFPTSLRRRCFSGLTGQCVTHVQGHVDALPLQLDVVPPTLARMVADKGCSTRR